MNQAICSVGHYTNSAPHYLLWAQLCQVTYVFSVCEEYVHRHVPLCFGHSAHTETVLLICGTVQLTVSACLSCSFFLISPKVADALLEKLVLF